MSSLKVLSECLNKHFGKEVIILIDEYDSALNNAFRKFNSNGIEDIKTLFAGIYTNALKGSKIMRMGILTGILRIAKSGILSGLNNLVEYSLR
jgi:hypothetical protein